MSDHDLMGWLDEMERALVVMPDESTANRHVRRAGSLASSNRSIRKHRRAHLMVAAIAAVVVVGTGSVATAGGLPRWMQSLLSDTGAVLPVPIHIPPPSVPDGAYTDETLVIQEQVAKAEADNDAAASGTTDEAVTGSAAPEGVTPAGEGGSSDSRGVASTAGWCIDIENETGSGDSGSGFRDRCHRDVTSGPDARLRDDGDDRWSDPEQSSKDRWGLNSEVDSWWNDDRDHVQGDDDGFEQDTGDDRYRDREESNGHDHDEHDGSYESRWRDRH